MLATEERLPFQSDLQVRGRNTLAFNSVKPEATKVHCTASLRGPLHVCTGTVSSSRPSTAQLTNDTAAPPQPLPSWPLAQLSSRPRTVHCGSRSGLPRWVQAGSTQAGARPRPSRAPPQGCSAPPGGTTRHPGPRPRPPPHPSSDSPAPTAAGCRHVTVIKKGRSQE